MDNSIHTICQQFKALVQSNKLTHAHLLECPLSKPVDDVRNYLISILLCSTLSNCNQCQSCRLLTHNTHPDLVYFSNADQAIKVADVRNLLYSIYQAPKVASYKIVVINGVEKLNRSAANALLKILEEPPKHVIFLLSCHNSARVIATIRSRCVQWHLPVSIVVDSDWDLLTKWIIEDQSKCQLLADRSILIEHINAVYEQKKQPQDIAQFWQTYPVYDLLWFLYLLHAWALRQNYFADSQIGYFANNQLLLKQIKQIHAMIKLVSKGIALNNNLMYESFLIGCKGIAE